jgi:hypothetical protein
MCSPGIRGRASAQAARAATGSQIRPSLPPLRTVASAGCDCCAKFWARHSRRRGYPSRNDPRHAPRPPTNAKTLAEADNRVCGSTNGCEESWLGEAAEAGRGGMEWLATRDKVAVLSPSPLCPRWTRSRAYKLNPVWVGWGRAHVDVAPFRLELDVGAVRDELGHGGDGGGEAAEEKRSHGGHGEGCVLCVCVKV